MGLTPTAVVLSAATRTGDIDPGVVIFILKKIAADDAERRRGRRTSWRPWSSKNQACWA